VAGIDLGVRNLVTLVNNIGKKPIVIKGGVAKSINQFYNKQRARLQRNYERQGIKMGTKLKKLTITRDRKLHDHLHKVSRFIMDWCVNHDVGTLVIGYNTEWKQRVNMGRKTNQNFVQLPFSKLIQQIQYKAEEKGIHVLLQEESHTSKCSFLDQEPIEHQETYLGQKKTRGLFQSGRIEGVGLHPERFQGIFRRELIPCDQFS